MTDLPTTRPKEWLAGLTPKERGIASVVVAGLVVWLLTVVFPHSWPAGLVLEGVVAGSASGLLAVGLVLTYRTTGVVNLSYQAMGACAAEFGILGYQHASFPWPVAIAVALIGGGLGGILSDLVMRRLDKAPRLIATVATIGLLQVFVALQLLVPYMAHTSTLIPQFHTGLSKFNFTVGFTPFYGDDLLSIGLVPVVLIGFSWFLFRTNTGTAARAIAENKDRARLLGIPVRRISRVMWIAVGALAAAVAVLFAPRNGLPSDPFVSTGGLFLPALAATVVAKMRSMPTAFFVAVGLGILSSIVTENFSKQSLQVVMLLVIVLAVLGTQRRSTSRAETAESAAWSMDEANRRLPAAAARLPEIVGLRLGGLAALAVIAIGAPYVLSPSRVHTVSGYLVFGVVALSLVVLSGWTGTVSLGQFAIVGVGAIVAGDLIVKSNLDLFVCLVAASAAGAVAGLAVGLPALRIKPLFVIVTSLIFAAAMDQFFLNPTNFPNWIPSEIPRPVLWKRYPLSSERSMYFLCLGVLVVSILLVRALSLSRPGRVMRAGRDNPGAAAALSVANTRIRVTAMMIAGAIAGAAGCIWAVLQVGVGTGSFDVQTSVLIFSMAVVGGVGSISGALIGVAATEILLDIAQLAFPQAAGLVDLAPGALLLIVLLVSPEGLGALVVRLRGVLVAALLRRKGLDLEVAAAAGSATTTDSPIATPAQSLAPTNGSALSCAGLTASYGLLQVLFGVDLQIADGEMVALLGTNGAGKSTIFKALTGLLDSSEGAIHLHGEPVHGMAPEKIAAKGVAMMPGGRGIFPSMTVSDNLRLASWLIRNDPAAVRAAQLQCWDMFPTLAERRNAVAGDLSGGLQQQLSLAMALAGNPKVLLIDELSLGLAPAVVAMLCNTVRDIHAAGTTVVMVEQSVNVALTLAHRAIFLEKGLVRFEGPTEELLERPDLLRSVFIGGEPTEPSTPPPSSRARRSKTSLEVVEPEVRNLRDTTLVCHDLYKHFGGIAAVSHVDLRVEPGEIIGLIGHNGAGKTTLFDLISGHQTPDGGEVLLNNLDVTKLPPHLRAVGGVGRSFQDARLFPSLTTLESVMVALDRHLECHDPIAAGFALPASLNCEHHAENRAREILEILGLSAFADTPTGELSTGTRRIVEMAGVVALDPAVLLLDEPTAGVAQKETEAIGPLLRRIRQAAGCSVVVIEHDMGLLTSVCDRLIALELGSVICEGTPQEVLTHPQVIASYLGTDQTAIQRSNVVKTTPDRPSDPGAPRKPRRAQGGSTTPRPRTARS